MKILYAGDSPVGGPADYLLAILKHLKARTLHLTPHEPLRKSHLKTRWDGIILSDYGASKISLSLQREIRTQVNAGTGLLMIGGWGSFSGPFGKWRNSLIEGLLPVRCLARDDRKNFPGGAWVIPNQKYAKNPKVLGASPGTFKRPPVICGINQVQVKKSAHVLLWAQEINKKGNRPTLGKKFPLLVIGNQLKTAAFMTDAAPHWCGGFVDWGRARRRLPVTSKIQVEVGSEYLHFFSNLLRWLAK